jgi:hypothetical protein
VLTTNGQVTDTVPTGTDGSAVASLALVPGAVPPESVVVTVSSSRIRGPVVPGSGQHFMLRFTP